MVICNHTNYKRYGHPNITLHSINYAQYSAAKGKDDMEVTWKALLKETMISNTFEPFF